MSDSDIGINIRNRNLRQMIKEHAPVLKCIVKTNILQTIRIQVQLNPGGFKFPTNILM